MTLAFQYAHPVIANAQRRLNRLRRADAPTEMIREAEEALEYARVTALVQLICAGHTVAQVDELIMRLSDEVEEYR